MRAQDRPPGGRLAATVFVDQPQGLTRHQVKANLVNRLDQAGLSADESLAENGKVFSQIFDL
jgi:hypothetical protein